MRYLVTSHLCPFESIRLSQSTDLEKETQHLCSADIVYSRCRNICSSRVITEKLRSLFSFSLSTSFCCCGWSLPPAVSVTQQMLWLLRFSFSIIIKDVLSLRRVSVQSAAATAATVANLHTLLSPPWWPTTATVAMGTALLGTLSTTIRQDSTLRTATTGTERWPASWAASASAPPTGQQWLVWLHLLCWCVGCVSIETWFELSVGGVTTARQGQSP